MAIEGHKDVEVCLLGTINFEDFINEQEIENKNNRFRTKSIGECKVEIYAGEGSVPHMHIFNNNKLFEACICIYSNNYFAHGGKYTDKFTSKQCKEFNSWMNTVNMKAFGKMTNWETAAYLWEFLNSDCRFPENRKTRIQPNYEDMINFRDK